MDLKESECGQIGVTIMQGTLGCTILAPAASEYAVLPVGVAMIIPGRRKVCLSADRVNFGSLIYLFLGASSPQRLGQEDSNYLLLFDHRFIIELGP